MTKKDFQKTENDIRLQIHIKRYAAIRRFLYGNVLDFACGCGYGTFLLSNNPEISMITGVDKDEESIKWANKEFASDKCKFECADVTAMTGKFDTLVSLETIEHFQDNAVYNTIIEKLEIDQLIISYPNKKSTHFNPFHLRDLNVQQVVDNFTNHILYHYFTFGDVDFLIFIRKPKLMPSHISSNLKDLY